MWASLALADAPLVSTPVNAGYSANPWSVQAADVDGDGDLDVLSASLDDDEVNWFENDGGSPPAFTPRHITTGATGASAVFAADVDGDGDTDVLSAELLGNTVSWHENDGSSPPIFTEHVIDTQVDTARAVIAADLDHDGDVDVVSASELGTDIAWYESDGASPPIFTRHLIVSGVSGATSVAAADVNGDGRMDVVSSSEHDDILAWHENDGASPPNFTRHVIFDQAQTALWQMPADIDGDGDIDVALASIVDRSVRWLENDGARPVPGWTEHLVSNGESGARSVFASDVDGDGDVDLLSAAEFDDKVSWHENNGGGAPSFTTHAIDNAVLGASSVYAGDLDGDGDVDAFSASFNDDEVRWFENRSIHRTARYGPSRTAGASGAVEVRAADVDADGDLDLLLASPQDASVAWLENDGASPPGFTRLLIVSGVTGVSSVASTDLDGDGDTDALSATPTGSEVLWHENDGADPPGFATHLVGLLGGASEVASADLDRDGDADVVAAAVQGGPVLWWSNDGAAPPGFTLAGFVSTTADGAGDLVVSDLDRDGDPDLVAASPLNGLVLFYENDGAAVPAFSRHLVSGSAPGASSVRVGDVDGDGDLDVVSSLTQSHQVVWYENDGATPPGFTTRPVADGLLVANRVRLSDVDHDGDLDVVASASGFGQVFWFENDGSSPPAFTGHLVSAGCETPTLELADLDRDGGPDAICARANGPIDWHRLETAQVALAPTPGGGSLVAQGSTVAVLRLSASHLGRAGDGDAELGALGLRFQRESGEAMTTAELNALVSIMFLVRDDGSGSYEPGSDAVALEYGGPIDLVDGVPDVGLPNDDPVVALAPGETRDFFVVLGFKPSAASAAVTRMSVQHVPAQGTLVRDRSYDLPLVLSEGAEGGSGVFEVVAALPQCSDGLDNDLDGFIDHPADPQCASASWDDESTAPLPKKTHCGLGPDLALLLPALMWLRRRSRRRPPTR